VLITALGSGGKPVPGGHPVGGNTEDTVYMSERDDALKIKLM
jgi:hypothetical protein